MLKKIIILFVIIFAIYYFNNINPDNMNINNNINNIISKSINNTFEILNDGNHITLYFICDSPDKISDNSYKLAEELYNKTNASNITIIPIINGNEPFARLDVIDGDLKNAKLEDIRTNKFKIINDLILYDNNPILVNLSSNSAIIYAEYLGDKEEFKEDLLNLAFNIFEDALWIDTITFNYIPQNISINISKDGFLDSINGNLNKEFISVSKKNIVIKKDHNNSCPPSKELSYKRFVKAYYTLTQKMQENASREILLKLKKEYDIARSCYENYNDESNLIDPESP